MIKALRIPVQAVRVRRHSQMRFMSFFYNRSDFVYRQRGVKPIGVHLEQVCTETYLFPRSPARLFGAADQLRTRRKIRKSGEIPNGLYCPIAAIARVATCIPPPGPD